MFRSELLKSWRVVLDGFEGTTQDFLSSPADRDAADECGLVRGNAPNGVFSGDQIPEVSSDGAVHHLDFIGLVSFEIDTAKRRIIGRRLSADLTSEGLAHALDDHCAPRILAHEGNLVLHGSGILLDTGLVVFLGETGAGKSTLAASFEHAGYDLLGDDAIVVSEIDGRYHGEATYRSLRLFPQSVSAIYGEDVSTSPMAHYSTKLHVTRQTEQTAASAPPPIAAIFYLDSDGAATTIDASLLSPCDACLKVLAQSFALDPRDSDHALQRLTQISQLVTKVPVFDLSYPRDFASLPDVHTTITALVNQKSQGDPRP